ncbi:MAG TPA: ATP-binding cassette domain-containing protein [Acidobacteriota bacterium]|nr:ATP-binding cassette domain-containing protein [Acidobacteriota bacterium]
MTTKFVCFEKVSYRYESMPAPLLHNLAISFAMGWTGVVGANGTGKTTVLKLACGLLEPREGRVQLPGSALYCAQRTDEVPGLLRPLIEAKDHHASEVRGRLGIGGDWVGRWDSLSHGERKRAQIAAVLWQQPAVLAIDEPTNHIDADVRAMLISALRYYRGVGLLVSHDRELLDALCHCCLFVNPPEAVMRPGNYSAGRREALREEDHARSRKEIAKRQVARLKTEAQRRISHAQDDDRKRWKKGLSPCDHDNRAKIDLARLTGADGRAGRLAKQMLSRLEQARAATEGIKIRKRYELGIWIGGERCRRDTLFRLRPGAVSLGGARELHYPDLTMLPCDRIALTGANGTGKSTLVRRILSTIDLPAERVTYLPQEIDLKSSCDILAEVRRQPSEVLGRIMTVVSRLDSRPARLLESVEPSPGELRKLLLALGIARQPYLIIMDEPTNHLDLPSIECLEKALDDCPCGLLLVSHDQQFLRRLTRTCWHIAPARTGPQRDMLLQIL